MAVGFRGQSTDTFWGRSSSMMVTVVVQDAPEMQLAAEESKTLPVMPHWITTVSSVSATVSVQIVSAGTVWLLAPLVRTPTFTVGVT